MEVQFFGNIGKDAELKTTQDNREQVSFTVAENHKKNGQEITNWVSCYFGNKNVAPYLKKGTRVYVRGELSANIYQTKEGESRISFLVFVNKLEMLGGQSEQKAEGNTAYVTKPQPLYAGDLPTGNVPF